MAVRFSIPLLGCALVALLLAILAHFSADGTDHTGSGQIMPVQVDLEDADLAIKHFSEILKFRTVSNDAAENHVEVPEEFQKLHWTLRKQWPSVFSSLDVQQVSNFSLLFEWKGSDPALKPILCVSHMDVVAVAPVEDRWTHPPFSGVVADGFVWGRGTLDLKFSVAGLLEAVSQLLLKGHKPARTLYIAIGHDEEVGGELGAGAIGRLLAERGVILDHILDEGGSVLTDGFAPVTKRPIAVVGASEKSNLNVQVSVHGIGGHAMFPPSQKHPSAAIRLARIVQQVESNPPAPRLAPPMTWFLHALGASTEKPWLGYLLRRCHVWPLSSIMAHRMASMGGSNAASTRSTVITTESEYLPHGKNVIPSLATANFNFRLLPNLENPVEWSKQFLEGVAAGHSKGGRVDVELPQRTHIAPLSPIDTTGFSAVRRAILETLSSHQDLVVAPYLMLGSTDSRHFTHLTKNVYRFAPFTCNRSDGDLQRVHGVDERVGVDTYLDGVRFYIRYIELATTA